MEESTSKEKIFKNIRAALIEQCEELYPNLDMESSVYFPPSDSLDVLFAQNLINVAGKFVYCENEADFIEQFKSLKENFKWQNVYAVEPIIREKLDSNQISYIADIDNIDDNNSVGITTCEYLIARLGSAMVSTGHSLCRSIFIFPTIHVILAYSSQLVYDLNEALDGVKNKYDGKFPSLVTNITGPSRTADIEKTLVLGAHGPREVFVFLIDDLNK